MILKEEILPSLYSYFKRGSSRRVKHEKPEFTKVNEDFECEQQRRNYLLK